MGLLMSKRVTEDDDLQIVVGLGAGEANDPLRIKRLGAVGAVQVLDGGGSGFNGGTVTIQKSIDGVNWVVLQDLQGTDITFTATGIGEFTTSCRWLRALNDASVSDVDVYFCFKE